MSKIKAGADPALDDLLYLVHHVFLPPKLPNGDDGSPKKEAAMLSTAHDALVEFKDLVSQDQRAAVASVASMVQATISVRAQGTVQLDEGELNAAILGMINGELGTVALHIVKQNAGVIITRTPDKMQLDLFELSPRNKDTMASAGRLRRYFPGVAIAMRMDDFLSKTDFASSVSSMLYKLVSSTTPGSQPKVMKAGQSHVEERDTASPHHVTEFITAFLDRVTKPVKDAGLWKNTRDEIMWNDAFMPWRRSPLWLLLRVSMQLVWYRQSPDDGLVMYKAFMLYLFARILRTAATTRLDSDYLEVMRLKVARRRLKLTSVQGSFSQFKLPESILQARQQQVFASLTPPNNLLQLEKLDLEEDVLHSLPMLDSFLESIEAREQLSTQGTFKQSPHLSAFPSDALPRVARITMPQEYVLFNIYSVEAWVASHLEDWIAKHIDEEDTCSKLSTLISDYQSTANSVYQGNPEGVSMTNLTIMELWVACDKSAIHQNALLREYWPQIPARLLQYVVLPFSQDMARLEKVELYLQKRSQNADMTLPYIFDSFGDRNSFAVRHYAQSPALHTLLSRIEEQATRLQEQKKRQLSNIKSKYSSLKATYEKMVCDEGTGVNRRGRSYTYHPRWCNKCATYNQMNSLTIDVYEWPLPRETFKAQATLFELQLPTSFAAWRDATIFVQLKVFGCQYNSDGGRREDKNDLFHYQALARYLVSPSGAHRIVLSSSTKPHVGTHRKTVSVDLSVTDSDVCLNNGMTYHFFDAATSTKSDLSRLKLTRTMPDGCTYKSKVKALDKFLYRPGPRPEGLSSNTVIANQSEAPDHISVAEFKALCSLPSENKLQWQNILLQLSMPEVDFRKSETSFALWQVMYQVGPPSDMTTRDEKADYDLRQSHSIVSDDIFCHELIGRLQYACARVKQNWESCQALANFAAVGTRVLSLSSSSAVHSACLEFLSEARKTAFAWLEKIRTDSQTVAQDFRQELMSKASEIGLICLSTFDVEEHHLKTLLTNYQDASLFVQACMSVQECLQPGTFASGSVMALFVARWRRLCHRALPLLTIAAGASKNNPFDHAIHQYWPEYQEGKNWEPVSFAKYWIGSKTSEIHGRSLPVHYNLLTGELLVNGIPVSRVSSEYKEHPAYQLLFGESILDVMPSNSPGMQFSVKSPVSGHTVNVGLKGPDNQDLIVAAEKQNKSKQGKSVTWQLVPSRVFHLLLPVSFVNNHVHWYDPSSNTVELRPLASPWTSSPENWVLSKHGGRWKIQTATHQLVSRASGALKAMTDIFDSLEDLPYLHVSVAADNSALDVELPRLQLGFSVRAGSTEVYSRQFRGMYIDPSQAIDTLTGLRSKLILINSTGDKRAILIPDGKVSYSPYKDQMHVRATHVQVSVAKGTSARVHRYSIDEQLGRLVDNGNFRSKIYIAYLHGLTSFCLPDKLTGYTGTEQALMILSSAAARSIFNLSEPDGGLLLNIASLTPIRHFYPESLREMQRVQWDRNLGFLSQHILFYEKVKVLFRQADRQLDIEPAFVKSLVSSRTSNAALTERDMVNCSWSRVPGFGAEAFTTSHDRAYQSRDRLREEVRSNATLAVSHALFLAKPALMGSYRTIQVSWLWNFFLSTNQVFGPGVELPAALSYDTIWLEGIKKIVARHWLGIHKALREKRSNFGVFQLMSWFSALAFTADQDTRPMIEVLFAFASIPEVASVAPPADTTQYNLSAGYSVVQALITSDVESGGYGYKNSPEAKLPSLPDEDEEDADTRRCKEYECSFNSKIAAFVSYLTSQWPCEVPTVPSKIDCAGLRTYFNVDMIMTAVRSRWKIWYQNHLFYEYLTSLAQAMSRQSVGSAAKQLPPLPKLAADDRVASDKGFATTADLFSQNEPPVVTPEDRPVLRLTVGLACGDGNTQSTSPCIRSFLKGLRVGTCTDFERKYRKDLDASFLALHDLDLDRNGGAENGLATAKNNELLQQYWNECQDYFLVQLRSLAAFESLEGQDGALVNSPRICRTLFLSQLSTSNWKQLPAEWKPAIIEFALALHDLQRARRLLRACSSGSSVDLVKELQNIAHSNWDPIECPQALLMEVESDITIRSVQFAIARKMSSPPDDRNSVMQLNMGEGKSSVIVPLVASFLADGTQLVRVIVAKPQSKQMLQMLLAKLGGLLDVQVLQLPFSRALRLDPTQVSDLAADLTGCMRNGGILLVQPEHILSFKLMGLECLINGKEAIGRSLLGGQQFFDKYSRDIVDESDENFSVRFELVYTMGTQRPIDYSPDRWKLMQNVIEVVRDVAPSIAQEMPASLEIHNQFGRGSFPRIRILKADGQQALVHAVASRICATGLAGLPIARQNKESRAALFTYLTKTELTSTEIKAVEGVKQGGFWSDATKAPLLLLRGILAGGVLGFTLAQKRWRVNYGLDATRQPPTRLAVPYRAKDSPSPRSEFSHPEVVLLLTSLSYYYGGLSDEDLFITFGHLLKSDQPDQEYNAWIADAPEIPSSFRHLEGVNIKDKPQCVKLLFPTLRYAKAAIDYFLGHVVFPKYIKEFPSKLSASGWDIGQVKTRPTSGFSGTNDARELLPLSVAHLDLPSQKHTNALVLGYLLRDDNHVSLIPQRTTTGSDADQLLTMVMDMQQEVQVLLDVGAQILELGNVEVARQWLRMHQEKGNASTKQACVYFDDDDNLCVVDLHGKTELLQTSSFATALDVCLVFLDEAHTRGTDLKLPDNYRAAVTLGANLTKDRLVQACMRMRKLGKGQTVVFCIPPEIKVKILQRVHKDEEDRIELADVLHWAITETWIDIQRSIPLWAVQGRRFGHQKHLWDQSKDSNFDITTMSPAHAIKFQEDEAQTIEDLYRPGERDTKPCCADACSHEGAASIVKHCAQFGEVNFDSAVLQEEQERELAPEIEQERQVERPRPAKPMTHNLDPVVVAFARTGVLPAGSKSFKPAFKSLILITAAKLIPKLSEFPQDVLVTSDFACTVELEATAKQDQYLRPVNWILTSTGGGGDTSGIVKHLVIISPFEAQALEAIVRHHAKTTLHLYAPRSTLGFASLEDLRLYPTPALPAEWSVPRHLILQLNLFAGQLYISSFADYTALCDMLGLDWEGGGKDGMVVCADGFVDPALNPGKTLKHSFKHSPVGFLKVYLTKVRRDCESIEKTHMGKILNAVILRPEDFESPTDECRG
ncbi:hypothetical protein PgNI_06587 [Pyricularia grisea]|uniref:ubiquitinyl hydrolase 1 n=1 Tax=Pyricularia grisea TaxID=148305 RepID=A0A6P8B465_PYRGI|nr:hypothetical protein PgNI_06587 [Pyricularia grisea]TLD10121.1 hypothetical protein PgNI_06587 [Pyricularia grisea]